MLLNDSKPLQRQSRFSLTKKAKRSLTIGVVLFFTLLVLALVPYATTLSLKAGDRKLEKQVTNGIDPNQPSSTFNGYLVYVNVTSLSTIAMSSNSTRGLTKSTSK